MVDEESSIYRELMRFKPEGWSANAWAVTAGVNRTVWSDIRRHGNPSRRTLEKLLKAAGSSLAEFEALRVGDAPSGLPLPAGALVGDTRSGGWRSSPISPLPLIASAMAGSWGAPDEQIELTELRLGEILDHLPRPASLTGDPGAYALTVVGDSMWPRFRPGRRIAVSPKAPVAIGDDVVVALRSDQSTGAITALLKELVRRTASFVELRQFNPDVTFRVGISQITSIQRAMGELF